MTRTLIERRAFAFDAAHEKGFEKLRKHQMASPITGMLREPIANALDQQRGRAEPIEVEMTKINWELACFCVKDHGEGLIEDNLRAFHFIGQSSKRAQKELSIGRFGMGFVSIFHPELGVQSVEIRTLVCGIPAMIQIDASQPGIPRWQLHPVDQESAEAVTGFEIRLFFANRKRYKIEPALQALIERMMLPVRYNGVLCQSDPLQQLKPTDQDILVSCQEADCSVHYVLRTSAEVVVGDPFNDAGLHLRGMPTEEAYLPELLAGLSQRTHLPQNYYGTAFSLEDSVLVLTQTGEPTLGRDKFVQDEHYSAIKAATEQARCQALTRLLQDFIAGKTPHATLAQWLIRANLRALKPGLVARLKHQPLPKPFQQELLDTLLDCPLFETFGGNDERLSINAILRHPAPDGVYAYAEHAADLHGFPGRYQGPFVLRENRRNQHVWGYHELADIANVLAPILTSLDGVECLRLGEHLRRNETELRALQQRGVITLGSQRLHPRPPSSPDEQAFFDRLRQFLNQGWFRHALDDGWYPPTRINLLSVAVETEGLGHGELVATNLTRGAGRDEVSIGLNLQSRPLQKLLRAKHGEIVLLPLLAHELAHRPDVRLESADEGAHGLGFHLYRIHLEERILTACTRALLGRDSGSDALDDALMGDLLVI